MLVSMRVTQSLSSGQQVLGYFIVLLLAGLSLAAPGFIHLESQWRDMGFRWLAQHAPIPVEDDLVIVGIDDADLASFEVPMATIHRQLGSFFEAMAASGPRVVGVDVLLPANSFDRLQTGLDAALARGILAMKKAVPLVLGISADAQGNPRPLHPLFASLVGKNGLGFIFVLRDPDGAVRRFDERLGSSGEVVPTLTGQMARALGVDPAPGLIHYALGKPYRYLPLREILAWKEQGASEKLKQVFGGKIVFLGSVLAFDDQHRGPVALADWSPDADTSLGVLFHAQALRSLLTGHMVHAIPSAMQWLLVLLLAGTWWLRPNPLVWVGVVGITLSILAASVFLLNAGWAMSSVSMSAALLLGISARTGTSGWLAARERRRLRDTFGGFVSPAVLEEILAGRLEPNVGGERRDVCVLFSDIRGFTTLSEALAPEMVTELLNRYFDRMAKAVHDYGGTLDKFMGDGIMVIYGAPQASLNPSDDAYQTARAMVAALDLFNSDQERRGETRIAIGIGLHYGPAITGYVGSTDRHEYSAIGDTVNAASRIEGLTKELGYPVLMSLAVYERLVDRRGIVAIGPMAVKGRSSIEVFGWKPEA